MRQTAPDGFDIKAFFDGIYTFQIWPLFPGYRTRGAKDVLATLDGLGLPGDLTGKRVLDIAPWNGFFSFECVRRGAAEVVSLGPDDPDATGYHKVRDLLEIDNCHYVRASVYDLSPELHGTFDIVLFLGVIYHLRHPLLALDRIFDVAVDRLYVDTPIIDGYVFDTRLSYQQRRRMMWNNSMLDTLPVLYFSKADETGDAYNWFMPNTHAFHAMVESSGFRIISAGDNTEPLTGSLLDKGVQWLRLWRRCRRPNRGNWAWLAAAKTERQFSVGVEGFNPGAAGFGSNN